MFPNERTSSLSKQIVPIGPGVNVRDVRKIIGCKMSSRDTKEYRIYSLRAGKGWLRFVLVMFIFHGSIAFRDQVG